MITARGDEIMNYNDRIKYQGFIYSAGICTVEEKGWSDCDNSHIPDCLEILYCISGEEEISIDGQLHSILPGTVRITPPSTQSDEKIKVRTLKRSEILDIGFITKNPFVSGTVMINAKNNRKLKDLFHRILISCKNKHDTSFFEATSLYFQIVQQLRMMMENREDLVDLDQRLAPAMDYLYNHYTDKELVLYHLPKLCGMNKNQFYHAFRERFSMTPSEYVTDLRMQLAVDLLKEGKESVSSIAEKTGYESITYFDRVFKKKFGVSPSQYVK